MTSPLPAAEALDLAALVGVTPGGIASRVKDRVEKQA